MNNRERLIVAGVIAALTLIVGGGWLIHSQRDTGSVSARVPANTTDDFGLAVGPADATHEIVIFEDFLCPACGSLEGVTNEQLTALADQGQVRIIYRPVSILGRIDDYSMRSANAFAAVLDSAGAEVAKTFHDLLFVNQPAESGPFPDDDQLLAWAVEAGAVEAEIRADVEGLAFERWVEKATEAFAEAGHNGTPTILVDGEEFGLENLGANGEGLLGVLDG